MASRATPENAIELQNRSIRRATSSEATSFHIADTIRMPGSMPTAEQRRAPSSEARSAPTAGQRRATGSGSRSSGHVTVTSSGTRARTRTREASDIEGRSTRQYTLENDPYQLHASLKTELEINSVRAQALRKRDGCGGPLRMTGKARTAKKIQDYYRNQNEAIEKLLKSVDEHVQTARELEGGKLLKVKIAVQGSFAANVVLAGLQVYGAVSSGSLSLFTTMADALFDPMSNLNLVLCHRAVAKVDPFKFPSGKARIETAGNIVFCFLMSAISFILIALSTIEIIQGIKDPDKGPSGLHIPSIIGVGAAFVTKFCLFLYCSGLRKEYSQVQIIWEDHRNDIIVNAFGMITSAGGSFLQWWVDPMGAIILSLMVSILWMHTAYNEFQLLIGVSAGPEALQWITYIAMTHSPMITGIDTVRAYYSGPRIIVEVDVVMDRDSSLPASHDVAEALQCKLESLPDVERAYVHIDYETSHKPEHALKKVL